MNPLHILAAIGFAIWVFFEWMRDWKRYREAGTQHFAMIGLIGQVIMIAALGSDLIKKLVV